MNSLLINKSNGNILLVKSKKLPIGTVSKGRKKVREGLWLPVKKGKTPTTDKEKLKEKGYTGVEIKAIYKKDTERGLPTTDRKLPKIPDVMAVVKGTQRKTETSSKYGAIGYKEFVEKTDHKLGTKKSEKAYKDYLKRQMKSWAIKQMGQSTGMSKTAHDKLRQIELGNIDPSKLNRLMKI